MSTRREADAVKTQHGLRWGENGGYRVCSGGVGVLVLACGYASRSSERRRGSKGADEEVQGDYGGPGGVASDGIERCGERDGELWMPDDQTIGERYTNKETRLWERTCEQGSNN
jgi:hypothetical protein